jgi:hypothetical protein
MFTLRDATFCSSTSHEKSRLQRLRTKRAGTQVPVENLHAAEESGQKLVHYLNIKNGPKLILKER